MVWQAELNAWWSYLFNFFAFLVLIADIVVSLNRGYYNQGILVLDRKKIYHHYLRYHSWIDILGLIVVMMCFFSGNFTLNYFKVLFLLKLYNLYLIDVTFQRVLQFHRTRSTIYLVSRLVLLMVMSCHYLGGIFYAIDYYVYSTNYYGPNTPAWCWIYNAVAYSQMVLNLPWWLQYEYCMYWSLATMTTIAYGDITPLNPMETVLRDPIVDVRDSDAHNIVHNLRVHPQQHHRDSAGVEGQRLELPAGVRDYEPVHEREAHHLEAARPHSVLLRAHLERGAVPKSRSRAGDDSQAPQ